VGVCLYVRLARDIPGLGPVQTDGKLLAKAIDTLDRAARKASVRPLSEFYSVSKKQALAEIEGGDDLTDDEWSALADDHAWWPASDGLASVTTLLHWAASNPDKLHRPEDVIADLGDFRTVLEAAVRENIEFHIGVSA
jgi:hypothetical protein